jgi:hypothetical protein
MLLIPQQRYPTEVLIPHTAITHRVLRPHRLNYHRGIINVHQIRIPCCELEWW